MNNELLGQNLLPNKKNINFHMLCSCMKNWVVGNDNCTVVITEDNGSAEGEL